MKRTFFLILAALAAAPVAAQPPIALPTTSGGAAPAATRPADDSAPMLRDGPTIEELRALQRYEPNVSTTMRAALRYFRVDPDSFDSLRSSARYRALLPTLAGGLRVDDTDGARFERQTITSPRENDENTSQRITTLTVGGVWDFRELVFNPAEVQVFGLVGVQRDVMLETTRVYFLRRQLIVRFAGAPPQDPVAREALLLRIDEFSALLDVLTGGWFSAQTDNRIRQARARGENVPPGLTATGDEDRDIDEDVEESLETP